jgi:hypothetical protein
MEEFRRLPGIDSTELRRLNQCRLYLQVTLLSEISSANGVTILPNYVRGNKHANRRSLLTWPRQERSPHKASWQEWNNLSQTFCKSRTGFRLRHPLHTWTFTGPQYQTWDTLFDPVSNTLFCHKTHTNTILQHSRIPGVGLYSLLGTHTTEIPSTASPAQILSTPTLLRLTAHRTRQRPPPTQPIQRSLRTRLLHLTPSEQQLVGNHFTMPRCEAAFLKDMIVPPNHSRPATAGFYKVVGPGTLCPLTRKHTLQISNTHLSDRKRQDMQQLSLLLEKFYGDNPPSTRP